MCWLPLFASHVCFLPFRRSFFFLSFSVSCLSLSLLYVCVHHHYSVLFWFDCFELPRSGQSAFHPISRGIKCICTRNKSIQALNNSPVDSQPFTVNHPLLLLLEKGARCFPWLLSRFSSSLLFSNSNKLCKENNSNSPSCCCSIYTGVTNWQSEEKLCLRTNFSPLLPFRLLHGMRSFEYCCAIYDIPGQ